MWSRKPIKALLFDVGGVLVHSDLSGYLQVGSMMFGCSEDSLGRLVVPLVEELERGEIDSFSLWEELGLAVEREGLGIAQDPVKFEQLWTEVLRGSFTVDESMMTLCRDLKKRIPVGALSNTISEHAEFLQMKGVYDHFNPCVLSHEVGMRKPDGRVYRLAAELINTHPGQCLLVDDLEVNVKAARAAGMQAHLFNGQDGLEGFLRKRGVM